MKRLCILGATGSIGRSTLEVCAELPNEYQVVALAVRQGGPELSGLLERYRPAWVGVADPEAASLLSLPAGVRLVTGEKAASQLATLPEVDMVVAGIVGFAGLSSTLAALGAGKTVALANKEAMVVAGELCLETAHKNNAKIIPVDSEHSAIFQAIGSQSHSTVSRLILTSSGGPFRCASAAQLAAATVEDALKHPTWSMGPKITVDSATLMNKALEVVEAHYLFGVQDEQIAVLVHPESLVHSIVEFVDGAMLAQLGSPDMRGPIGYALSYPERRPLSVTRLDLAAIGKLTFERPDSARFPCVTLGHEALRLGGTAPTALSAANEVAVSAFLNRQIQFSQIAPIVQETLAKHQLFPANSVEAVREADQQARVEARRHVNMIRA